MNLRWKLRRGSDRLVVEMLGDFDETADLRDLVSVLRGRIAIDLGGVRRFSSAGVREWIHFVRSLPQGTDLSLVGCSTASVIQLNLIDNFRGPARVESFWAPYACVACGAECEVLLEDRAVSSDGLATFPVVTVPELGSVGAIGSSDDIDVLDDPVPSPVEDDAVVAGAMAASSTTSGPINMSALVEASARALPSPPPVRCDACGHSMVLDELPQHYLLFLADHPVRLAEGGRN